MIWDTYSKFSSATIWQVARHGLLEGYFRSSLLLNLDLIRNLDLILTINLKYSFSWHQEFNVQEPFVLAFGWRILKFTKTQSRLRCDIQICDLKLSFSWEIYFIVSDVDHELDFLWLNSQRKKWNVNFNVVSNNSCYISGGKFVKHFFSTCKTHKNLKQNKAVPFFKTFLLVNCATLYYVKINSHQKAFKLFIKTC